MDPLVNEVRGDKVQRIYQLVDRDYRSQPHEELENTLVQAELQVLGGEFAQENLDEGIQLLKNFTLDA